MVPLSRFIDARNRRNLLANGITFTRKVRARELIEQCWAQWLLRQYSQDGADSTPRREDAKAGGAGVTARGPRGG